MSDSNKVVPFGKYRGRPVADLLADQPYLSWLEAQPWFREKFGWIVVQRVVIDDTETQTPEHNRLQALFLDPVYCVALAMVVDGIVQKLVDKDQAEYTKRVASETGDVTKLTEIISHGAACFYAGYYHSLEELQDKLDTASAGLKDLENYSTAISGSATFEVDGWDVVLCLTAGRIRGDLLVEIKPTVADEYPAILRQMKKSHREVTVRNGWWASDVSVGRERYAKIPPDILFLVEYQGVGVTEEQFVAIFAASGIQVVFKAQVDAEAERLRSQA